MTRLAVIRAGLDQAVATAQHMPMVHPHLMGATAMMFNLREFISSLTAAARSFRVGIVPFAFAKVAQHPAMEPELLPPPARKEYPDMLPQNVKQVMRTMSGVVAVSGSEPDRRAVGEAAKRFKKGEEDDGLPWPARRASGEDMNDLKREMEEIARISPELDALRAISQAYLEKRRTAQRAAGKVFRGRLGCHSLMKPLARRVPVAPRGPARQ